MKVDIDRLTAAAQRHSWRAVKMARSRIRPDDGERVNLLITGCQRSGTTMLSRIFDADPSTYIFDEMSSLSSNDDFETLRLNDLDDVRRKLDRPAAKLIVAKPLVESQRLAKLLDEIPRSKSIWMFRHYDDVIRSNKLRFGVDNGLIDIQPILDGDTDGWRGEGLTTEARDTIVELASGSITPADASALFWYGRNSHFFAQSLETEPRVRLQSYEDLVTKPDQVMVAIYDFLGRPFPGDRILRNVHARSVGKGRSSTELSPPIEALCVEMMARLEAAQAPS